MRLPSSWTKHAVLPVAACVASLCAWLLASFSLSLLAIALLIISAMLSTRRRPAIALVVVSTLLAVAAADLLVGVLLPPRSEPLMMDPTSDYADKRYHDNDSDLGFQPRPGVHTSRKLVTDTGEVIYDVVYTIDEDGFRAMPEAVGKSPQVNLFGGSFAFGEGLNDDETLAHFLLESLRVGVKSYAVHGYGMHQALAILQRPAPPLDGSISSSPYPGTHYEARADRLGAPARPAMSLKRAGCGGTAPARCPRNRPARSGRLSRSQTYTVLSTTFGAIRAQ